MALPKNDMQVVRGLTQLPNAPTTLPERKDK